MHAHAAGCIFCKAFDGALHVAAFLGRFPPNECVAGATVTAAATPPARGMCNNDVKQNMQLEI